MTLRQLELFIAVAETSSFSRGAELMSLTQSTVSQHIAALERELKTRLLDRTSKGIYLTAGGEVLLKHARSVLAECSVLEQAMAGFHGLEDARLSLGASNIPANYVVPRILPILNREYPGIILNMISGDSREILDELRNGKVELALTGSRVDDDVFDFRPFITDQLVFIVGPDHIMRKKKKITLKELAEQPLVVREDGSGTYQALQKAFSDAGLRMDSLNIRARLGSNEAVRQAVTTGGGCAFVSDLSIRSQQEHGELIRLPVAGMKIKRQLWMVKLKERTPSPAAAAVADLLLREKGRLEA